MRNFLMPEYLNNVARTFEPQFRFNGSSEQDFSEWKEQLIKDLKEALGPMPGKVNLNPEIIWEVEEDGLIKRRVVFDVEKYMSVPAIVYIPESAKKKPAPAILCCHGHGKYGKDSVMGITSGNDPQREKEIEGFNYDYGLQMAKQGYVTLAIDWRGFGERSVKDGYPGRDECNVLYIQAGIMGINLLALDIFDGFCALDYLCSLDCVDDSRIGAMGLSFGGTMTTWISLLDERIKAADIICYSAVFKSFAIRDGNFCGSQIIPGIFRLCDVPDLHGLIAPRPLLAEIGIHDKFFKVEDATECSRKVKMIYEAAGVGQNYEVDLFDGDHRFSGNKAFSFFDKYLKG